MWWLEELILLISLFPLLWLCGASLRLMKGSRSPRYSDRSDYEDAEEAPSSSSTPPMREDGFQYDVFLSFRGPDTRNSFTDHLYHAMQDKGIHTFIDSEELEKGKKVEDLFGYIDRSKIFVPIFSKGYADSEWCLKEITKMIECKRLIIPVFFDVEPRDVRHQSGPFVPAFKRHHKNKKIDKNEVSRWSDALKVAGQLSGYTLASTNGYQRRLIKLIVKRILTEVNKMPLFVAGHRVGLDSRVEKLVEVLELEAQNDVKMVGIHGMGGIGKTTLARAVYNKIYQDFDACSFISDVRKAAEQSSGLVSLQEQLLRDVFNEEKVKVNNISHGTDKIMKRIKSKKVLLVLDDVDSKPQLDALAGSIDSFCSGSRIIITTRDKRVLIGPLRVENVYELKVLNDIQSLQLFCWHAFGKEEPQAEIAELSKKVADTAAGLPLALEIFGSHFFGLDTNKEREDMLKKLKKNQNKDIHERLKISFDALDEDEKTVFLDIACFFIGEDREFATFKWKDICPDLTIKFLMHKSLININEDTGQFVMHDQIRDMGRKIVEDESRSDPGMRSRLWMKDDILYVLQNKRGTEKIEAIDMSCLSTDSAGVDVESFAGMSQLRMLLLWNVTLGGKYKHFPKTLKWLRWNLQHLDSLPSTLPLENITVIDLSGSSITQVWKNHRFRKTKVFGQLKVLNLKFCWNLTICPDFKCMPQLEKLDFSDCENLTELHPSIGRLKSLTCLSLRGCKSLKKLPASFSSLISLEFLDLSGCSSLSDLPGEVGNLQSLTELLLSGTAVKVIPDSINQLRKLERLLLDNCEALTKLPGSLEGLESLQELSAKSCTLLATLPTSIGNVSNLTHLLLDGTMIEELPNTVGELKNLSHLLPDCENLTELHPFIGRLNSLTCLSLRGCKSLKKLPASFSSLISLKILDLSGCSSLIDLPGEVGNLQSLMELLLSGTAVKVIPDSINQLRKLERLLLDNCEALTKLPGSLEGLKSLQVLSAKSCTLLATLPTSIGNVSNLTHLLLDGTMIEELPNTVGELKNLSHLLLNGTMIKELPNTVGELKNLSHLLLGGTMIKELPNAVGELENLSQCSVRSCKNLRRLPASMRRLRHLKYLDLSATGIRELPDDFGALSSLTGLQMCSCKEIKELPESFSNLRTLSSLDLRSNTNLTSIPSLRGLSQLKELNVVNCENLKMIPQLPSSLTKLRCDDCTALERVEDVSNLENLIELNLSFCTSLVEINGIDSLAALRRFHMSGCKRLSNASRNQLDQKIFYHLESFCISGGEIPRVFTNRQLSYEVPVSLDVREGMELLLCLVVAVEEQAVCWEPNIKVETEAEGEKIVKLPGVALSSKDDTLCLWHYKEADMVFPRGYVKITLLQNKWIKEEVKNGGLCEPKREVEAANEDGQQVSVFECIACCCRTSNTA